MCGICGQFNMNPQSKVNSDVLKKSIDLMKHRGIDDSGMFIENNFGMGMRRLSIIDLDSGKQPIFNENQKKVIIFNGEIYNYKSLRDELISKGHNFKTKSDTETILHLYEEYGVSCLEKLDGMFAFAIWDREKKEIFLARDRLGIKPLFYSLKNGMFIFASELKSIIFNNEFNTEIDRDSLWNYFSYSYIPGPDTLIKYIKQLEPGYYLKLSQENDLEVNQYWDISYNLNQKVKSESEYFDEFQELFENSVKKCLISDVPVGLFVSGGVDSNGVLSVMSKYYSKKINTYTIGFEEDSYDESSFARQIAERFGTNHNEIYLKSKDVEKYFTDIIWYSDNMMGLPGGIPIYILSKLAREHNKVVLDGSGGDELFFGYPTYQADIIAGYVRRFIPSFLRNLIKHSARIIPASHKKLSFDYKIKKFTEGFKFSPEKAHYWWRTIFTDVEKTSLLKEEFNSEKKSEQEYIKHFKKSDSFEFLKQSVYADIKVFLLNLLYSTDSMSMGNSLEVRPPFLDYKIIEFATNLPLSVNFHHYKKKYFLRRYFKKSLPKEVINRKKLGFHVPLAVWINSDLKEFISDKISEKSIKDSGVFNSNYVQKVIEEHRNRKFDNSYKIWTILSFLEWYRLIIKKEKLT